jgi:ferredoxin
MPLSPPALIAVVDRQLCDECGLCMPLCPPTAIHMRREGLLVDPMACTGCRKCIAPCPVGALTMVANPVLAAPAGARSAGIGALPAPGAASPLT